MGIPNAIITFLRALFRISERCSVPAPSWRSSTSLSGNNLLS